MKWCALNLVSGRKRCQRAARFTEATDVDIDSTESQAWTLPPQDRSCNKGHAKRREKIRRPPHLARYLTEKPPTLGNPGSAAFLCAIVARHETEQYWNAILTKRQMDPTARACSHRGHRGDGEALRQDRRERPWVRQRCEPGPSRREQS